MDRNFQQILVEELLDFVAPLSAAADEGRLLQFLEDAGWALEPRLGADASFFQELADRVSSAADSLSQLSENPPTDLAAFDRVLETTTSVFSLLGHLPQPPSVSDLDFDQLAADILNALSVLYIEGKSPLALHLMELMTLVHPDETPLVADTNGLIVRSESRFPRLGLGRAVELFSDPGNLFREVYWPTGLPDGEAAAAVAQRLFLPIQLVLGDLGIVSLRGRGAGPQEFTPDDEALLDRMITIDWEHESLDGFGGGTVGASIGLLPQSEGGPGVFVSPFGELEIVATAGGWLIVANSALAPGGFQITRSGIKLYEAGRAAGDLELLLGPSSGERADRFLIGSTTGTRLELGDITVHGALHYADGRSDFELLLGIQDASFVISVAEGDGFLSSVIPGEGVRADFSFRIGWGTDKGFFMQGSGGLEIQLPLHVEIGPVDFQGVALRVGFDSAALAIAIGGDIGVKLGPLAAVVDDIGAELLLSSKDSGGNLGPIVASPRFKPPSGVGLSLDAEVVKGGGYLFFDSDREEYAGALELVFSDWIALKAIGLLTTRMPDGSKGFSLLIIITVEFATGIQLGLGFTLNGVGGLLGWHRVVRIEPLAEGVRTGAIEGIMFPKDVIANAPRIISDLRTYFPPERDSFLIGPMAKLGWGTPTLAKAQIGLLVEIPSINITILGVIKVVLPDEKADILRLQVNFIGRLEPSKKLLWFYAELYDSRVLFITIEGGFGLLVQWGDKANFVVSAGGFHPRYNPPPLPFPNPPRLAISLLNKPNARIRIEAYFAITSNSVQFGARVELFFGVSKFNIEGHLGFDALFQFDPFFFSFNLSVGLSVKVFGIGLFSVGFSGLLEGPTPWHIKGKGKIKLLFFKISVPFEHRWGVSADTTLSAIAVHPLLEKELRASTNWKAEVPSSSQLLVTLRQLGESQVDQLVFHPIGRLVVSQRKLPLDFRLDKIGNQRPADYHRFEIGAELGGGGDLVVTPVQEQFAIGQFKDLDAKAKTSAPGFEEMNGGVAIAVPGEQLGTHSAVRRVVRYETIIVDTNYKRHVKRFFGFFLNGLAVLNDLLFTHFLVGNATTQSPLSQHQRERRQPFAETIQVRPQGYSVVSSADLSLVDDDAGSFTSHAAAEQYRAQQVGADRSLATQILVVPNTELGVPV